MKKSSLLLLCAAFLVTAAALFYTWTNWSGARELRATLAQLEAKKESVRVEDFIPPPVPDDRNVAMAPIFQEFFAKGKDSRLGKLTWPWKNLSALPAGENHLVSIAKKLDPQFSGDKAAAGRVVLESLSPSAPVLEEVGEALLRAQVDWSYDYSKGFEVPLEHIYPLMTIGQLLRERSLAELAVGSTDKAAQDTLTLLALAGAIAPPRLLICELVQNSFLMTARSVISDGLSRGVWSDGELAAFSEGLPPQNLLRQLADSLRLERAMIQNSNWFDLKPLMLAMGFNSDDLRAWGIVWQLRPPGWVNRDRTLLLVLTQRMIEALGTDNCVSPTEVGNIAHLGNRGAIWDGTLTPFTSHLLPPIASHVRSTCFTQTLLESTRAACAVERYRLANNRLPDHLNDLVPAFLAELPKDPITGAPLIYKISSDGSFVIYGVGWNETDDGGSLQSPPTRQSANPQKQADWGVFVPKG